MAGETLRRVGAMHRGTAPASAAWAAPDRSVPVDDGNILTRRLSRFAAIADDDRAMLDRLAATDVHVVAARRDLNREGDPPRAAVLVLAGWASRYKTLEDGRRQTVGFLLPGDLCDLDVCLLDRVDHATGALTSLRVARLSRDLIDEVGRDHPRILLGLRRMTLATAAIQREWIVSLGQRSATERIAHLLCELYLRLDAVGLVHERTCEMPLTQSDLAEATGMTAVHVNRTIKGLRARDLIQWRGRQLEMCDLAGLMRLGLFTAGYLHLDHPPAT